MVIAGLMAAVMLAAADEPREHPLRARSFIVGGVGAALVIGGSVFVGVAGNQDRAAAMLDMMAADALRFSATSNRVGSALMITAGVLTFGIALLLWAFELDPPSAPAVSLFRWPSAPWCAGR